MEMLDENPAGIHGRLSLDRARKRTDIEQLAPRPALAAYQREILAIAETKSRLQDSGFEFGEVRVEGGGLEGPDQRVAGVGGVDDGIDPEARGGVARIGLMFVGGA